MRINDNQSIHPSPVWRASVNLACRQRFSYFKKASLQNVHFSFERGLIVGSFFLVTLLYYTTLHTMTGSTNAKIGQPGSKSGIKKPTMTKEERREKYTAMAKKRRDKMQNRGPRPNGGGSKEIVCYQCRQTGHSVTNCPMKGDDASENSEMLCYRCGSTKHALSSCKKRSSDLPFATCFICKEKGHLASGCSQNEKGIYVNGGSCRYCDSRDHLATVCPDKKKKKQRTDPNDEVDINDLLEAEPPSKKAETKVAEAPKKRRVVKF
jgi:zinc finger CCHC domain-containing protein 9